MLIEESYLVVGLVEFGGEDDLVPDRQANVVIQQLVGKDRLGCGRVWSVESFGQSLCDAVVHFAAADVDDSAIGGDTRLGVHDVDRGSWVSLEEMSGQWPWSRREAGRRETRW